MGLRIVLKSFKAWSWGFFKRALVGVVFVLAFGLSQASKKSAKSKTEPEKPKNPKSKND